MKSKFEKLGLKILIILIAVMLVLPVLPAHITEAAHTFDTSLRFTGNAAPLTSNYTVGSGGTLIPWYPSLRPVVRPGQVAHLHITASH